MEDMLGLRRHFRFVPIADMALTCRSRSRPQHRQENDAPQQIVTLFDRLVGPQ
jgi:hypothetical protein